MKLSSLLRDIEYRIGGMCDPEISCIARELTEITPGCLFICIRGTRTDTHRMLPEIAARGAVAVAVEIGSSFTRLPSLPILEVRNTRALFATVQSRLCGSPEKKLRIIGITGTNGKTSTAFMLYRILCRSGFSSLFIGTVGYFSNVAALSCVRCGRAATMTTPEPEVFYPLLADAARLGITHAVMEVSSHALIQERVAPIRFALAAFTGLSPEHLDYHRTMEEYLSAKEKLFRQCEQAVISVDSDYGKELLQRLEEDAFTCSLDRASGADVFAKEICLQGADGVSFRLCRGSRELPLSLPIPGKFTVQNALLAASCALRLGISEDAVAEALSDSPTVPGRMERVDTDGMPFSVLIDYAHTEAALRALLIAARPLVPENGRLTVLFGCGGNRDKSKRAPMGRAVEELADYAYVTSDNSRSEDPKCIIREILRGMPKREKRRVIVDRRRAINEAITSARSGDLLLLVGKGHERYELRDGKSYPFDERKIVREALEKRRSVHTNRENEP